MHAHINGKIKMDWFNLGIETFKIRCKKLFLLNENDEQTRKMTFDLAKAIMSYLTLYFLIVN